MNNTIRLACILLSIIIGNIKAKDINFDYVSFEQAQDSFTISHDGKSADIYVDWDDYKVCHIAAEDLCDDIERVTGKRSKLKISDKVRKTAIVIGTVENNRFIKKLIKAGKLDVSEIKGQWESCIIQTIDKPFWGIDKVLVIAGSDRRGAAFGVYDLSQKIGVSPWYWWADVPIKKHASLFVKDGHYLQDSPSVKYRGIFINDEDWGMHTWAEKTFSPEDGGIGPKVYEKVFELLLRLKANHLWPAMHICTRAFNSYPENKVLADDYAIVMGSSHCEQMLRDNVWEWENWYSEDGTNRGPWDWSDNSKNMTEYWRDRVKENAKYENIYTTGLRALHDEPMNGNKLSPETKKEMLQNEVLPAQRKLIEDYVNPDTSKVPQIFCPYKEVLELYELGMELPDDITLMWPDDNYSFLRRLPTAEERKRSGSSGVYYHVSYFTGPWLWLCTTPPALVWEEMHKAYEYGADRVWMLNIGDIKPGELVMDFFLQMAWDIDKWDNENVSDFLADWFAENFPPEYAKDIADIMHQYYRLGQTRKPEHMTYFWDYRVTPDREPEFSPYNFGDEIEKRIEQYYAIMDKTNKIYDKLPDTYKNSFFQLVAYPVRASAFFNKKAMYARKSRLYAELGRVSADDYAAQAKTAFELIRLETEHYNKVMAGGKWNGMMQDDIRQAPTFGPPNVATVPIYPGQDMGVMIEGQEEQLQCNNYSTLPTFEVYSKKTHFVDIFSKAEAEFKWTAEVSDDWIILDKYSGKCGEKDSRIWVSVDWAKAPANEGEGSIKIIGASKSNTITVKVLNPDISDLADFDGFIETGGYISMEAENYNQKRDNVNVAWERINGLGRTGDSVTPLPSTATSFTDLERMQREAPALEYNLYFTNSGDFTARVYCLPTHAANPDRGLRYAIAIDGQTPQIVEYDTKEFSDEWIINVLRSAAITESAHNITTSGKHTLKIWMVDPSVVLDKIVIYRGKLPLSYLGPEQTNLK